MWLKRCKRTGRPHAGTPGYSTPRRPHSPPPMMVWVWVPSGIDKFKEAARELERGDDEQRFKERLGNLVRSRASDYWSAAPRPTLGTFLQHRGAPTPRPRAAPIP
jgi:hypothetical protein